MLNKCDPLFPISPVRAFSSQLHFKILKEGRNISKRSPVSPT